MGKLAPLLEEPISEEETHGRGSSTSWRSNSSSSSWSKWLRAHLHLLPPPSPKESDLKLLLSVLGCPLSPISVPSSQVPLDVSSQAQYIIQQFRATAGTAKFAGEVLKSLYVSGKVAVAMLPAAEENGSSSSSSSSFSSSTQYRGSFVFWQMVPGNWLVELVVSGSQVKAGSDGRVAWRHTPWHGVHAAPGGGARPLRRALQVSSQAQYIIQQFRTTAGTAKFAGEVLKSLYVSGKVAVAMLPAAEENGSSSSSSSSFSSSTQYRGSFVYWQMVPGNWLVELVVSGSQVKAGSDGRVAWRHTPWHGVHAAPGGGARPLRRALQGLDPLTIATIFASAQYVGEKTIDDVDCFALKVDADQPTLSSRSDNTAEIIKHVMVASFSQKSGLLVHLEDSQLSRIQPLGAQPTYWETTMASHIADYRPVEGGGMVAHSGRSVVSMVRFGEEVKERREATRMEEEWVIDDVVFNVPGLSIDYFIPPK